MLASILSCVFVVMIAVVACSNRSIQPHSPAAIPINAPPTPNPRTVSTSISNQAIRSIDFNHVAFPRYPEYTDSGKRYVTIKEGEGGPANLNYGDVTGDGIEEAMMMLGIEIRGSAILEIVYVYGLENGKPILLWSFETGDRADGGLRQVYADQGNLVVELFGKDRIIGKNLYRGDEPLSGPSSFGSKFRLKGIPEVLPNPAGDAGSIMPPYVGPAG
jgi:hypothetical protein